MFGSRSTGAVHLLERAVLVLAAFLASASRQLLLAGGGALLGRALTGHRGRLVTGLLSSAVIAVLAVTDADAWAISPVRVRSGEDETRRGRC